MKKVTEKTDNKLSKERIEKAISERAYELENMAIQMLEFCGDDNIDYNLISILALKEAIEEFNTNKLYV